MMQKLNEGDDIIRAHEYSSNHRSSIMEDKLCGCFYCLKIFLPPEISEWAKDARDKTAICPYCGIDSVIGESSGFPITVNFLKKMHDYWFSISED